jgi:hypothetical protein
MLLRIVSILAVSSFGAIACSGDTAPTGPSEADVEAFCEAGIDLVKATIEEPGSDDALDAFEDLDADVAEALDVRLRRLDPERNDDPEDMADRFVDAGCDKDDFAELLETVPGDTIPTTIVETVVETTIDRTGTTVAANTTNVDTTTPPNSTVAGGSSDLVVVPVGASAPSGDVLDEILAQSTLTVRDAAGVAELFQITSEDAPFYVPENGVVFAAEAGTVFGSSEEMEFMLAEGDVGATLDALVAAVEPTDDFEVSTDSSSSAGSVIESARLGQRDFQGSNYEFEVETSDDFPGLMRATVRRTNFDFVVPRPPLAWALEEGAELVAAGDAAGFGAPDAWQVALGYDTLFGEPKRSVQLQWSELTGDFAEIGRALCDDLGLEISGDDEFGVYCNDESYAQTWYVVEGFEEGTAIANGSLN